MSFLPHHLQILEEDLLKNMEELDGLRRDVPSHLFGDGGQVMAKMTDFSQLEQQWAQVTDCVHRLKVDLIPWRKLVDVQEELQNRFDRLKATAEEQLELARRSGEEQEDIREFLIVLKVRHCAERNGTMGCNDDSPDYTGTPMPYQYM